MKNQNQNQKRESWMKSYPELEGKVIKVYDHGKRRIDGTRQAIIIGCDYDIGITLVYAENPSRYFYCHIGPLAPNFVKSSRNTYDNDFYRDLSQLQRGFFNNLDFYVGNSKSPSASTCPFGQ